VYVPEYHWDGTPEGYLRRLACRVCIFSTDADLVAIHLHDREAFDAVTRRHSDQSGWQSTEILRVPTTRSSAAMGSQEGWGRSSYRAFLAGGHLWIFAATPLLASECRIYIYNLALRLGVPVAGGGLKEGIEVFPKPDSRAAPRT
jgi:hypothetical protein